MSDVLKISLGLFVGLALVLAVPAQAQVTDDQAERIDAMFSQWDRDDSPGCALGVYQDGEIAYDAGYGVANLDHGIPITPETVFYIGSVSKQLVTAAIARLAIEGDISLDDDIRTYVPEMPEYEQPITIRHLVHHTSGIRDIYALMQLAGWNPADVTTQEDVLGLIASQQSLNFTPGEEYMYSNAGYFLLAQIVGRASDSSLREYANDKIFEPLGMENTHFHDDRTMIVPGRAMSYQPGHDGFRLSYLGNFEGVGAGGLYSTIHDFVEWDQQLAEDRLGLSGFSEMMLERGGLNNGEALDYAFALTHEEHKGLETVGHGGSFMGFRSDYVRFPEQDLSVAVFCNLGSINPGSLSRQVADILLGDEINQHLVDYTGTYYNADLDRSYELEVRYDRLYLQSDPSPSGMLHPAGKNRFRLAGWILEFTRNDAGQVETFTVDAGRARGVVFERQGVSVAGNDEK